MITQNDMAISVVIPTKNNVATIASCINGIQSQIIHATIEIIVIDSGSTDGTLDVLSGLPVKLHRIPSEDFNHGETRNLGVSLCTGNFVVMTVADAIPNDPKWLSIMVSNFEDPLVMAVTGQQIAPVGEMFNPLQRYKPVSTPQAVKYSFPAPIDFDKLSPAEQGQCCSFDDVTAVYRRSALLELPFEKVMFGEDMLWARKALRKGWTIVFDPKAQIYHYHEQTLVFSFKRSFIETYFFTCNFGIVFPSRQVLRKTVSSVYWLMRENCTFSAKIKWFIYNLKMNVAIYYGALLSYTVSRFFVNSFGERVLAMICKTSPTPKR